MFDRKGLLVLEKNENIDEDELMMLALDAGAEDISDEDDAFEIITAPSDFTAVRDSLENAGYSFASAEIAMIPQNYVDVDEAAQEKIMSLIERLEDHDDVQNVFTNLNID
jgi:transcriptional/translational regulatory protein YebC/TACO1